MKSKVSYKPLEISLIMKDKNKQDLKKDLKLSPGTVAKIGKNEYIALSVIHKICDYLDCTIQEVVEFVREES